MVGRNFERIKPASYAFRLWKKEWLLVLLTMALDRADWKSFLLLSYPYSYPYSQPNQ